MASKHRVSYERLLASLLKTGSVKESAEELNISTRTIYTMMSEQDFKVLYENSQADILNSCVHELQKHMIEAVECIAGIMNDPSINPQIRLQSANSILKQTVSVYEAKEKIRFKAEEDSIHWVAIRGSGAYSTTPINRPKY